MTTPNKALLALLDEYKRALRDFYLVIKHLDEEVFHTIRDASTPDPDCRSIQTICFHVVQSGYTYANYLYQVVQGSWHEYNTAIASPQKAIEEAQQMMQYTAEVVSQLSLLETSVVEAHLIQSRWGVTYDIEQLLEHAIVHVLRHRRQIEQLLHP